MKYKNIIITSILSIFILFVCILSIQNVISAYILSNKIEKILIAENFSPQIKEIPKSNIVELEQQKHLFGHENFTLTGILGDECLINDKWYKLNQQSDKIKVIEINSLNVKIEYGNKIIVLNLEIKNGKKNERKN